MIRWRSYQKGDHDVNTPGIIIEISEQRGNLTRTLTADDLLVRKLRPSKKIIFSELLYLIAF